MDLNVGNLNTKIYYINETLAMGKNRKATIATVLNKPKALTNKSYVDTNLSTLNTLINVHVNNNSIHLNSDEHTLLSGITINNTELNNATGLTSDVQAQINAKVSKSGDTMAGPLTLYSDPINNEDLATKSYVDSKTGTASPFNTGDLVIYPSSTTPTGFLKCNGAEISKTTYSNLYTTIGEKYTVRAPSLVGNAIAGAGQPWVQQYAINTTNSATTGSWSTANTLPSVVYDGVSLVTSNYAYLLGGQSSSSTYLNTIYQATVNDNGDLGNWNTYSVSLPSAMSRFQVVATKSFLYVIGGYNGSSLATVYKAPLSIDGSIGSFSATTSLPVGLCYHNAFITNGRIYVLGGWTTASVNTIYYATINSDGTLSSWTSAGTLPVAISQGRIAITNGYVYYLGGYTTAAVNSVYYAPINADGSLGSWTTGTALPATRSLHQVYVTKNYVFLFGGNGLSSVHCAPINTNGTLGSWVTATALPANLANSQLIATSNYIYLLGGNAINTIYRTSFNGGLNDYKNYLLSPTTADSTLFNLPNFSSKISMSTLSYYIKT